MHAIFGDRVRDLVVVREAPKRRFAPALWEKEVEEPWIIADHPQVATGALYGTVDVTESEHHVAAQVAWQFNGVFTTRKLVEVTATAIGPHLHFVLWSTNEKLIVDHRIPMLLDQTLKTCLERGVGGPFLAVEQRLCILLGHDDVLRLHIRNHVTFGLEIADCEGIQRESGRLKRFAKHATASQQLHDVEARNPLVHELILTQNVELYSRVARVDPVDFGQGSTALPELHAFGRYVDGEWPLRLDAEMAGPECAFTHLHDERKLFSRAVELSTQRFFNGVRVNRYVFPDAAVLHHQVHASARYLPRGHPEHGARTV